MVSPRYAPAADGRSYRHFDDNAELIYTPELNMLLPRLTSSNPADIESYADWAGMTEDAMQSVEISYALDSLGKPVGRPTAAAPARPSCVPPGGRIYAISSAIR